MRGCCKTSVGFGLAACAMATTLWQPWPNRFRGGCQGRSIIDQLDDAVSKGVEDAGRIFGCYVRPIERGIRTWRCVLALWMCVEEISVSYHDDVIARPLTNWFNSCLPTRTRDAYKLQLYWQWEARTQKCPNTWRIYDTCQGQYTYGSARESNRECVCEQTMHRYQTNRFPGTRHRRRHSLVSFPRVRPKMPVEG